MNQFHKSSFSKFQKATTCVLREGKGLRSVLREELALVNYRLEG